MSDEKAVKRLPIEQIPALKQRKYSRELIVEIATRWLVMGSKKKALEGTGVPEKTLTSWFSTKWWNNLIDAIRDEKAGELDAALTGVIHKAVTAVSDRLEGGEYRLDKEGKLVRVPVSARDAMMVGAIAYDKRQLNRSLPTSISETTGDRLRALQAQLEAVSGRVIDVTPEGRS